MRGSVLRACAFGLVAVVTVALIARAAFELGAAYPAKATFVFAAIAATVFAFVGEHHQYSRFGSANHVTLIRATLVALTAGLIGEPVVRGAAAAVATAAAVLAVLDGVDGWLARRSRMLSAFGARFDVETDALHVMVMSVLVWQYGKAGAWVLLGGILRYAFVAAGWLVPWMARPLTATLRGRIIAVCHMVGLNVAIAPIVPAPLSAMAAALTLAVLSWSFAIDVRRLWRQNE